MKTKLDALFAAHREAVDAYKAAEAIGADDKILDKLRAAEWQAFLHVAHYEPTTDEEFFRQAEHVRWRWDTFHAQGGDAPENKKVGPGS